jgi:hypothetical protein
MPRERKPALSWTRMSPRKMKTQKTLRRVVKGSVERSIQAYSP